MNHDVRNKALLQVKNHIIYFQATTSSSGAEKLDSTLDKSQAERSKTVTESSEKPYKQKYRSSWEIDFKGGFNILN